MAEEKQITEIKRKCAQTGKAIKRVRRYYRNGLYFVNKAAFKAWNVKKLEEKGKAEAEKNEKAAKESAAQAEAPKA